MFLVFEVLTAGRQSPQVQASSFPATLHPLLLCVVLKPQVVSQNSAALVSALFVHVGSGLGLRPVRGQTPRMSPSPLLSPLGCPRTQACLGSFPSFFWPERWQGLRQSSSHVCCTAVRAGPAVVRSCEKCHPSPRTWTPTMCLLLILTLLQNLSALSSSPVVILGTCFRVDSSDLREAWAPGGLTLP